MAGAIAGAAWLLYRGGIAPLQTEHLSLRQKHEDLRQKIAATHQELTTLKDSDQKVAEVRARLNAMLSDQAGDPLVNFPRKMQEYFGQFGYPSCNVRLVTTRQAADLSDYQKIYWSIGIPIPETEPNLQQLLVAVTALEQGDRYIKMTDFAVEADPQNPNLRVASLNLVVLGTK